MISTVSFSFDLTASPPRAVIVDSTNYATLLSPATVATQQAKGYGVLTFNGDIIEEKNTSSNPLIDIQAGQTTAYIDLPLDNNGNVANGVYGFEYSLRLDSTTFLSGGTVSGGTTFTNTSDWLGNFLKTGDSIDLQPFPGSPVINTVSSAAVVGGDTELTLGTSVANGTYFLYVNNVVTEQFNETYSYAGCTQTTADVNFTYDCEYGNSGTWAVSNATVLGSNEIVSSLSCTINYPSWTNVDPIFNPQIITTSLPYSPPVETEPLLATGTYSVILSEQIQQTQSSGLTVLYSKSITKEFTVSCAGTLCGLVPCIENLRAAHAAELIRNKVSKYQVYVDNVLLYYTEAMNYKACGELDKYKETIALLQAQLDASGCDCACCDDETYYWVSNNSANSIIDELLANFQFRLYDGEGSDPGPTQTGVELGALWEDTSTGILYRCTDATPSYLQWEQYYDPNAAASSLTATPSSPYLTSNNVQGQLVNTNTALVNLDSYVDSLNGTNGVSRTGNNFLLGGSLTQNTTINKGTYDLNIDSTSGDINITSTSGDVNIDADLYVSSTGTAIFIEGTTRAISATATNDQAAFLEVNRTTNNTVAENLVLRTSVDSGSGLAGLGTSIQFESEGTSAVISTAAIESLITNPSTGRGSLQLKVKSVSSTPSAALTLNDTLSATLNAYGGGTYLNNSPKYFLSIDSGGLIYETSLPIYTMAIARISQSGLYPGNPPTLIQTVYNNTAQTFSFNHDGVGVYRIILSGSVINSTKTSVAITNGFGTTRIGFVYAEPNAAGYIILRTYDESGVASDGVLNNATIEIKIFE